jgi:Fe-S cluster biogenesis protein NfuA
MTGGEPIERVRAALENSVLPLVIARGGGIRVLRIEGTDVILEVSGSPGSVVPLLGRIENLVRAAVPEVSGVRLVAPGDEPTEARHADDLEGQVRAIVDAKINPIVASHRGHVSVVSADQGWVRIRLEGGCQGCSLADVTVRQGIEPLLRVLFDDIVGVVDVTDHAASTDPYFSPEKR